MIVDIHTRIWESSDWLGRGAEALRRRRVEPWERPDASPAAHHAAMVPVRHAIIHGYQSAHLGASIPLEQVAAYVAEDPARYLGFAGIDPTAGGAGHAVRELERALSMGLVGVTVSPTSQGFHPADSRAMALYQACEAKGVPILFDSFHLLCRDAKLEFGVPTLLDEVARTFPELRLILSGLGHPWIDQGLALIGKHPTIYADLSDLILHPWQVYQALLLAYQHDVMGQVLFGSNFPLCTPEKAIVTIYSVNTFTQGTQLPSIPREQLRAIVERDALGCLGLKAPEGAEEAGADSPSAGSSSAGSSSPATDDASQTQTPAPEPAFAEDRGT